MQSLQESPFQICGLRFSLAISVKMHTYQKYPQGIEWKHIYKEQRDEIAL